MFSPNGSLRCLHTGPLATWDTVPTPMNDRHGTEGLPQAVSFFLSLLLLPSAKAGVMYKRELATQKPGDHHGWLDGFWTACGLRRAHRLPLGAGF